MNPSDKNLSCSEVREQIAWGTPLNDQARSHVADCPLCSQTAMEFSLLDSQVQEALDARLQIQVPDDFAERVMSRIAKAEESKLIARQSTDWMETLSVRLMGLMGMRPVQIGFASLAFAVTVGNLARFVFALLIPVAA